MRLGRISGNGIKKTDPKTCSGLSYSIGAFLTFRIVPAKRN
ncbi:hypothetical protein HMPREF1548_05699 [Clostridium sp. KLE 1755]|nr:hypothetical protein HMPREF1548_05699 [Clostridium sp. KLE 1755]